MTRKMQKLDVFIIVLAGTLFLAPLAQASEGQLHYDLKRGYYRSPAPVKAPKIRKARRYKSPSLARSIGSALGHAHKNNQTKITRDNDNVIVIENAKSSIRKKRGTTTSVRSVKIPNTGRRIVVIERD